MQSLHQTEELPPKKEIYLFTKLTESQKKLYKEISSQLSSLFDQHNSKVYLNALMELRKVCNHPYVCNNLDNGNASESDAGLISQSGKMIVLDKLLEKSCKEKSRVVIFSQTVRILDILEDYCLLKNYKYCRIDGNTDKNMRIKQVNEFIKPDFEKFIFLISKKAGGLGIDLSTADTVVLYDEDWNPVIDENAINMVYRAGQKNAVTVYRLIAENTIEENILHKLQEKEKEKEKRDLTLKSGETTQTGDSLKIVIEFRKDELLFETAEDLGKIMDDDDFEDYLKKCEVKTWEIKSNLGGSMLNKNEKYEKED